jgi:hypothetical protein
MTLGKKQSAERCYHRSAEIKSEFVWAEARKRIATTVVDVEFLEFRKRLRQTDGALAGLPLAAFLHELYAFKTLHNTAFGTDGTAGRLETWMLGHDILREIEIFRRAEDVDSFQICKKLFRIWKVRLIT